MPSINRIRVNNVKYNFGTQYYDDFTMRMYGKNTLYDLANGDEIQPSILSSNGSWMSRIARKAIAI